MLRNTLIGFTIGAGISLTLNNIWYFKIRDRVVKPVAEELNSDSTNYLNIPALYFSGFVSAFSDLQGGNQSLLSDEVKKIRRLTPAQIRRGVKDSDEDQNKH